MDNHVPCLNFNSISEQWLLFRNQGRISQDTDYVLFEATKIDGITVPSGQVVYQTKYTLDKLPRDIIQGIVCNLFLQ